MHLIIALYKKKRVPDFANQVLCDVISSRKRVPHTGSTTFFCYSAFMVTLSGKGQDLKQREGVSTQLSKLRYPLVSFSRQWLHLLSLASTVTSPGEAESVQAEARPMDSRPHKGALQ